MSLSKRINGDIKQETANSVESYEDLIRQLKVLSKSQTAFLKAHLYEKLSHASTLILKAAAYLDAKADEHDPKAKEIRIALNNLKINELEVDFDSNKIALQEELSKLRNHVENSGGHILPPAQPTVSGSNNSSNPADLEKLKALEKEVQSLREQLKRSQSSNAPPLPPDVDTAELSKLKNDLSSQKDKVTMLTNQVQSKDSEISSLNQQLTTLKLNSASANKDLDKAHHDEVERLKKHVATLETEKKNITKEAETKLSTKLQELKDSYEKLIKDKEGQWNAEKEEMEVALAEELEEVEKNATEEKNKLEKENNDLLKKLQNMSKLTSGLQSSLRKLAEKSRSITHDYKSNVSLIKKELSENVRDIKSQYSNAIVNKLKNVNEEIKNLNTKYRREMSERKRLHNLVQELKGNIRVFLRCRPPSKKEMESFGNDSVCVTFPNQGEVKVFNEKNREKVWEFDEVFDPNTSQEQVYEDVSALVTSVLDGYNVCIFAYGQTGSGKTWTMSGPADNRGVNTRALEDLFNRTRERSEEWNDTITVSILEVYNEEIRDLLTDSKSEEKLEVKMGEHGNYVPGLTHVPVDGITAVLNLIALADKNRSSSTTNMNEHSSRSHMMLTVNVISTFLPTNVTQRGKLNLVDLAGSERINKSGAQGQALKEAQNINKSLSALGDVIAARAAKQAHVPFRNSTLTFLLQDSLSQDSKTLMIVCISPVLYNAEESFCSLNFAARVRTVELGKISKNVAPGASGATSGSTKAGPSSSLLQPTANQRRAVSGVK